MDFENYPFPPIQEAVLDIFATLPVEVELEALSAFGNSVAKSFPHRKPRYKFSSKIRFNPEDSSQSSSDGTTTQTGWIYRTHQKERAVQARLDGFSYNRLPIYEGWKKFSDEARAHWNIYREFAAPQFVTSIGLRYINRVLIPMPFRDFREYCLLFPDFPRGIPTALSEFMMRLVGPSSKSEGPTSAVIVTFQPPNPGKAVLPLILDVQVTQPFSALPARNDDRIWSTFELLRNEKNVLFESSITESARQLFRKQ